MISQISVFDPIWVSRTRKNDPRGGLGTRHLCVTPGRRARAKKHEEEAHTVSRPDALQPKQVPAGYSVADYSKDRNFILLCFFMMSDLHCTKVKINDTDLNKQECFA